METSVWDEEDVALLDLLDRALDKGVVLWGELTLTIADIELVYVGIKALLCSVDTAERLREAAWEQLLASQEV